MQFRRLAHAGALASVAVLAFGCSSAPQVTHHWVSNDSVSGSEYRRDLATCSQNEETIGEPLSAGTSEFQLYVACMNARGYQLASVGELEAQGRE